MPKLFYIVMLSLTVAACQPGERRLDISVKGARQPDPRLCGQGEFVVTQTGKVQCLRDSN
jgi:hypothetical protein